MLTSDSEKEMVLIVVQCLKLNKLQVSKGIGHIDAKLAKISANLLTEYDSLCGGMAFSGDRVITF
jgi:hypothetical protein